MELSAQLVFSSVDHSVRVFCLVALSVSFLIGPTLIVCHDRLADEFFFVLNVCLLPLNIACVPSFYQTLLTFHFEWIMAIIIIISIICIVTSIVINIIVVIIIVVVVISSYYCYYYRFQISILPLRPFPRGFNIS